MQAGEGAGVAADFVGHDWVAQCLILLDILIGVDQHFVDLRGEAFEHVLDHGFAT